MKHKRLGVALLIVCAAAAGGAGFLFGQMGSGNDRSGAGGTARKAESTLIAVVNLDEGTEKDGEKINYAESISSFPSADFEYSSLEEARTGFENGTYGAYIIIPATFSQSVESINSTPETSWLQYAVNQSYSGEVQYELLYNVVSYAENLNNSLSYMYIDNILAEFHSAQDGAASVMANDIRDKEAIDQIEAYDLVALVQSPELVQTENTTEMLDVTGYTQRNSELAQEIDEQYMQCVSAIQQEISELRGSGSDLSDILTQMAKEVEDIDVSEDEQGGVIAETADAELEEELGAYVDGLIEVIDETAAGSTDIETYLARSTEIYNKIIERETGEYQDAMQKAVKDAVPALTLENRGNSGYVLKFQETDSPQLTFAVDRGTAAPDDKQILREKIIASLAASNSQKETIQVTVSIEESSPGAGDGRDVTTDYETYTSVNTVLAGWDSEAQGLGYQSAADFLSNYDPEDVDGDAPSEDDSITVSGDVAEFTRYIISQIEGTDVGNYEVSEFEGIVYDENGKPLTDKESGDVLTVGGLMEKHSAALREMGNALSDSRDSDIASAKELVRLQYMEPVQQNVEEAKEEFARKNEEEKAQISDYDEELSRFAPQVNTGFLTENSSEMAQNNAQMQEALSENNMAYMEYAGQVFEAATENVTTLEQMIADTKESSDEAVTGGLSNAKSVKQETSIQNQDILEEFALKLPYTRLGSVEYTRAYQFIAAPINTEDISGDSVRQTASRQGNAQRQSSREEQDTGFPWVILYITGWVLVLTLMTLLVVNAVRHRRRQ